MIPIGSRHTKGGISIALLGFTSKKLGIQKHPLMDLIFGLDIGPKLKYWFEIFKLESRMRIFLVEISDIGSNVN